MKPRRKKTKNAGNLQTAVGVECLAKIDSLIEVAQAPSRAEVIRRAVALYAFVHPRVARGDRLMLLGDDGDESIALVGM